MKILTFIQEILEALFRENQEIAIVDGPISNTIRIELKLV